MIILFFSLFTICDDFALWEFAISSIILICYLLMWLQKAPNKPDLLRGFEYCLVSPNLGSKQNYPIPNHVQKCKVKILVS